MNAPPCIFLKSTLSCRTAGAIFAAFFRAISSTLIAIVAASLMTVPLFTSAQSVTVLPSNSAASAPVATASAPRKPALAALAPASKPTWTELTPLQQLTLKPLAPSWSSLNDAQKRKWLEISKNYHSLPAEGQATMHSRMNEWVTLSPQQRAQARLNFAKTKELSKQLTPDEKKAKWMTYQALSDEEKRELAAKAPPRQVGAAPAVKPVSPQKLTAVAPHGAKSELKVAPKAAPGQADPAMPSNGATGMVNLPPVQQR